MLPRHITTAFALILSIVAFNPQPAPAFEANVLNSVVSVLPNWLRWKQADSKARMPDAPEGTAVAILAGGYLITNAHVLGSAKEVDIRLNDGKLVAVQIVGRDLRTDLALLKAPEDLPLLPPSAIPSLGSDVCSVGNQFGLGLSVTCGVVSAVHRTGTGFNVVEDFIQTDATVNPGGSGGALVNTNGQLVGMVSAIFTKNSDSNIGINFAASTPLLMRVATDIRDHGRVMWGRSGLRVGALSIDQRRTVSGAKIIHIEPDGAAQRAGLKSNDIIVQVGDRRIIKPTDATSAIALYRPGDKILIIYQRPDKRGGERRETTLLLAP